MQKFFYRDEGYHQYLSDVDGERPPDGEAFYLASEVDAKLDGYQKLTAECGDVIRERNTRIAELARQLAFAEDAAAKGDAARANAGGMEAQIAQMQIEIDAVTKQRDETYAKLVEARETIQRITFGSNR